MGPYIDGVVWSLVVEAVFYALIALLILRGAAINLFKVAIVLGALSSVYIAVYVTATLLGHEALQSLFGRFAFKVFLLRHGVFFAVGMLIWDMLRPVAGRSAAERIRSALPYVLVFCCFGFGNGFVQRLTFGAQFV